MNIGDTITGTIRSATFSDGDHPLCDCYACPGDCSTPNLPEGTYITVRLDEHAPVGLFQLKIERTA